MTEKELKNIEDDIEGILGSIEPGYDYREGLKDTPKRVAQMYQECFSGYDQDPAKILEATFEGEQDYETFGGMVIVKSIPFYSFCEHHIIPFFGTVDIGYIPDERIVGLSKLARVVDVYAKRLQVQERMTEQITKAIHKHLKPMGIMVVVRAEHLCMSMRGVQKPGAKTVTSSIRGVFIHNPAAKQEFLELTR